MMGPDIGGFDEEILSTILAKGTPVASELLLIYILGRVVSFWSRPTEAFL
jgi:hypothetical protein